MLFKPIFAGWNRKQTLYGSGRRSKSTVLYFVGTRRSPVGTSEISKKLPSSPYRSALFVMYGPRTYIMSGSVSFLRMPLNQCASTFAEDARQNYAQPTPTSYYTTRRNYPTPRTPQAPSFMKQIPAIQGSTTLPRNEFNKECLEAHNFFRFAYLETHYPRILKLSYGFRAIHNVPPLQWSDKLSKTAQKWADQLKFIAPRRPTAIEKPHLKTFNWPHSVVRTSSLFHIYAFLRLALGQSCTISRSRLHQTRRQDIFWR